MVWIGILAGFFFLFAIGGAVADYIAPYIYNWFINMLHNTDRKRYGRNAMRNQHEKK